MKNFLFLSIMSSLIFILACQPKEEDKLDIGLPPQANFSHDFLDPNNVKFTNTTADDYFITSWDLGDIGVFEEDVVEVNFPLAGEYAVTLTVFGRGGATSKTEIITIDQDGPGGCTGLLEFLTDCATKTWKLNPAAGALWVGPDPGTTWWASSADDVTARDCDWNDEYILSSDGVYEYDAKGDLWGETYMGFGSDQCYDISELPQDRAAWGSGTHAFEVIPGNPEKIKVIGEGAFLGLRKATNSGEITHPVAETIYDVLDMRIEGGKDILEIEVNFGGGIWRYTLASE